MMKDQVGETMQKQRDGDQPERRFAPAPNGDRTSAITSPATRASPRDAQTRQSYRLGSRGDCPPLSTGFDEGKKGVLEAAMTRSGLPSQLVQIPLG